MKLTCLGRYGPYPAPGGRTTCYLLQAGHTAVVVDFGAGALSHLLEFTSVNAIHAIVLSHLHADHCSDLRVLSYMLNPAALAGKRAKLKVYLPDGPKPECEEIALQPAFDTEIIDPAKQITIGDLSVSFQKTVHSVPCFAMRFEQSGKAIAYTADSVYDENLVPFVKNADLLICDAAFSNESKPHNAPHMSGAEAGNLASLAKVKRLMLTHINPETNEQALEDKANAAFLGATLAKEHASVTV